MKKILALLCVACGPTAAPGTTPDAAVAAPADAAAAQADACVPSVEICDDGIDNDCNGFIDDRDQANDGIFDCARIALFGQPGARPSSNFLAWLESNGSRVERVQTAAGTPLTAAMLAEYDVILLDQLVRTYTPAEEVLLHNWIDGGGSLMVLTGYTGAAADHERPNSLLTGSGLRYKPGLLSGPVTMFTAHPITEGLSSVTFEGGYLVEIVAGVNPGANTIVARLPGGAAGIVQTRGEDSGRVFIWGDEWVTFDSEWTSLPEIKQFWVDALGWLEGFR